jgi:hypothetical protein
MTFQEYIASHLTKQFKWGENDCCTFCVGWVQIKTGRDYLTAHRPWRTARQAAKKLRDLGGLFFLLEENLTSIHPNMAQDGDLAIVDGVLCLFTGRHVVAVGMNGLEYADRTRAQCAWRC